MLVLFKFIFSDEYFHITFLTATLVVSIWRGMFADGAIIDHVLMKQYSASAPELLAYIPDIRALRYYQPYWAS